MPVDVGLFGKHPGYGDFVRANLSDQAVEGMTGWFDSNLHELRTKLDNRWGPFWDNAQELRFWIGHEILGQSLCGVLRPSEDRVGRRYPLIMALEAAEVEPPVADPDQGLYEALSAHMAVMEPGKEASALLEGLESEALAVEATSEATKAEGSVLWAHHPEDNLTALLAATAKEDAVRARAGRSYWWTAAGPDHHPLWLGQPGLPDALGLAWLLAGIRAGADQPEEPTKATEIAPDEKEELNVQQ